MLIKDNWKRNKKMKKNQKDMVIIYKLYFKKVNFMKKINMVILLIYQDQHNRWKDDKKKYIYIYKSQ